MLSALASQQPAGASRAAGSTSMLTPASSTHLVPQFGTAFLLVCVYWLCGLF